MPAPSAGPLRIGMHVERTKDRGGALDAASKAHEGGDLPGASRRGIRARAHAVAGALGAATSITAALAGAAPGDEQAGKGILFAHRRDCVRAVPLLEQAERMRHRPSTAVALAECHLAAGDLVRAGQILHKVAGEKATRSWVRADYNAQKEAKTKLPEVDARIPALRFQVPADVEGLAVEVDGVHVDDLSADRPVAPDVKVSIVAHATDRRDFSDKVVLNEGERRVIVLRLPPSTASSGPAPRPAAAPTSWLGVRYYGVVVPKFVMNLVADGGRNLVVPGGALTFTTRASDAEVTFALGYLSYRMGDTPFKPHGEPDTEWELDSSTLQAFTATVDLMWRFPIDAAGNVTFRVGGAAGFGWMALGDLYRVQVYPPKGVPGDPSTYVPCIGPNNPRGTYRYCDALDKDATHYPGYTEPDWFHHGLRPAVFPWLVVPQLGFTFHPARAVAIDVETGASIAGFLTTLGARFGL